MTDWSSFDSVFRSKTDYSLDQKQFDNITRSRKELGGILFFDKIYTSIGLKQPQKSYPPKTNTDLRNLWQKIVQADVSDEKKQAVLFYILKECRLPHSIELVFARKVYLPTTYQTLVAGFWELDHLHFSRALDHLTDPSLTSEFADDILLALLTAPGCDQALAKAYYLTVQPPLVRQETLNAYFALLVNSDIVEAYRFCGGSDALTHKALFDDLLRLVHEDDASVEKMKRTTMLISLPFTKEEQEWFESYLLRGSGSRLAGAKDSVLARRLVTGQSIADLGTLDRHRGQKLEDVNWDDVRALSGAATV